MKKILVADDDEVFLNVIVTLLTKNGYEVIIANNGNEAYEKCKQHKPDAVLLDILMPDMNGDEVADKIKEDPEISDTPIIFVTGMIAGYEVPKDKLVGGQYMVAKPFRYEELRKILDKIFSD